MMYRVEWHDAQLIWEVGSNSASPPWPPCPHRVAYRWHTGPYRGTQDGLVAGVEGGRQRCESGKFAH